MLLAYKTFCYLQNYITETTLLEILGLLYCLPKLLPELLTSVFL